MNIRDAVRVVALLALATCVTTEMCPATTRVPVTCSLQSGTEIELSWSIREYITVECLDNGTFSCAELPKLSIPVLPTRVMIDNCVLPTYESLSCTFQVLGASGATLLTLRGPHSFLKPEHVQGLHLSTLNLKGSTFDEPYTPLELPTSALAALSSLQKLVVTNARLNLSPDSLAGVSQLKHLELSSSDITGLNQSVFRELKSLLTLSLWGNDLRELQSGTFDGLQSLQSLELFDPLQSLDEGVFAAAENLRELRLENIELDELSQAALRDLNELEELIILEARRPLKVGLRALSLPKLRVVRIERCGLETLPGDALAGARALQTLSLSHNAIEMLPLEFLTDLTDLRALNLSHNALRSLEPALFQSLLHLEDLKLDHNRLEVLSGALFEPVPALRVLSARKNDLRALWSTEFRGLGELQKLDLAHNQLTLSESPETSISPLHAQTKLRQLGLGHNNITQVFDDWRNSLLHLELLDLRYNQIEVLEDPDTNFLSNVTVDFRFNRISMIKIEEENQYARVSPKDTRKGTLLIGESPFHCDCHTFRLLRLLANSSYEYIHPAIKLDAAVCATPPTLTGIKLREVPLDKLTCELPASKCPLNCNCTSRPARNTVELDCIEPPATATMPDPPKDFNRIALRLRRAPLTLNLTLPVHDLQVTNLGLTEFPPGPIPTQLELLDLRNNLLTEISGLASGDYKLRLAGNPLACDCAHHDSINALLLSINRIEDWNNVTCAGGRYLKHIKDADGLCAEIRATWAASIGGALASLGLIAVVVTVTWLRYQNEIKVYLFARGWCGCLTKSGKEAPAKYDVFVSFSHEDEEVVVHKLVPELEQRGYRLCVHYRDWAPGEAITEHLSRSVREARRTLVVVSRGFLRSEWARAEFREAHARALREGRSRVIVVLLGELPAADSEDDELRAYLRTNTYVAWGDAWFWRKLQYALPHQPLGLQEDVPLVLLSSRHSDKLQI